MSECKYKNVCVEYRREAATCNGKDEQITCGAYNSFPVTYIRQRSK